MGPAYLWCQRSVRRLTSGGPIRRRALAVVALLPLAGAAAGCALIRGPSVRPKDVSLTAVMRPPGLGTNLLLPNAWTLDVTLDLTPEPGAGPPYSRCDQIVPVIQSARLVSWQFLQGAQLGTPTAGWSVGMDGPSMVLIQQALQAHGWHVTDAALWTLHGFQYSAARFPARLRVYLLGTPQADRSFVVFTHRESRRGQDPPGWWRAFPVGGGQ